MNTMEVTKQNFQTEVLDASKPVLVDFWADWCGPCQMLAPVIDELAAENADIKVVKVNVDQEKELAKQYRVLSIPTLMVIRDGEIVNRSSGVKAKEEILQMVNHNS